jgi:hypothetical protein
MKDLSTGTGLHWRCSRPQQADVIGEPAGRRFAHTCQVWNDNGERGVSNGGTHEEALHGAVEKYFAIRVSRNRMEGNP